MISRSLLLATIGLVSVILVSSIVAYEISLMKPSLPSPSIAPQSTSTPEASSGTESHQTPTSAPTPASTSATSVNLLWQRPLENFAAALTVDDGKVFILDATVGAVNCYDIQSGRSLWNSTLTGGPFYVSGLVVSDGRVYAGAWDDHVVSLDEATGKFEWSVQGIWNNYPGHPVPPYGIRVEDNRVYSFTDTVSVNDAVSGELIWQAFSQGLFGNITDLHSWQISGYPLSGDPFEDNFVYATGGSDLSNMYFFKLNTDSGAVVWKSNVTWDDGIRNGGVSYVPRVLAITQGQVVIENSLKGDVVFGLNSTSGEELWSFDLGARFYSPTAYEDLLLFGASDGYFYALNIRDGTVAWKTNIDNQNLIASYVNSTNPGQTSAIQIDPQTNQVFWGYRVELGFGSSNYLGQLCSLDLFNGNLKWTKQIDVNGTFFGTIGLFGNNVFLIQNNGLYIFNKSTGNLVQSQHYDHYVLPPVVQDGKTFLAADLWLYAFV